MRRKPNVLDLLRSTIFSIGFYIVTIIYAIPCLVIGPLLPYRPRYKFLSSINYFYIFWLRVCCGVKVEVHGAENLPKNQAFLAVSNHQSEWETLFLQLLIRPQVIVLKKELLKIPFFGWALALLKPIALDRSARRGALKQLLSQGKERLGEGLPILIFPQGTRLPLGELGKFNKGAAMLAASAEVPVVPIVHDAGACWPGKAFVKTPGTVTVHVGKPIPVGSTDEMHTALVEFMTTKLEQQREMK